jgi:hypothetical protein
MPFYHGTSGEHSFKPGDLLTPEGARNAWVYYTSHFLTARRYAAYAQPRKPDGRPDFDADPVPGRVYAVQPETRTGRRIGRHAEDPMSGYTGNEDAYRTRSRLRVLYEVDRETGRRRGARNR